MRFNWKQPNWGTWAKGVFRFWLRRYKLFFLLLFIAVTGVGGYQWHQSLFAYQWTPDERRAYLESTVKETAFDEKQFLEVLSNLELIREQHATQAVVEESIFPGGTKKEGSR